MKQYYVYELFDQEGTIVYVGMSTNPERRFYAHTKEKLDKGKGTFYGRTDLTWRIIQSHNTKKEAFTAEGARKLELGMIWSELTGGMSTSPNGGITTGKLIRPCPYCSIELKGAGGYNSHIKKCKTIRESDQTENQSLQDPSYLDPYHL